MSVGSAAYTEPDRSPESEQRIASMEINQSAGNMTGDDYLIALIYAYIDDSLTLSKTHEEGDSFKRMQEEASSKFSEYRGIYYNNDLDNQLQNMMVYSAECDSGDCIGRGSYHNVMPAQGWIDLLVYEIFHNDSELGVMYPHKVGSSIGISDDINKARTAYKTRITEEAQREVKQENKAAEQLRVQQENAARQTILDANYKNIFENYSTKIANLLNQSDFNEALNLSNESISALVSPYSNIMMITQGDIYMRLGKYQDAIDSYNSAQTDFTYSNESAEYKNSIRRDFVEKKWDRIVEMKIGIAKQNIREQMLAQLHDLRNAPDAKRLLAGHDQGRKYTVTMLNYTFLSSTIGSKLGYAVLVNVSAYDDPKATDVTKYLETNIPMCIDMFAALFSDKKVSNVRIQTNESYFDKFGHIQERQFMTASLDNATAMQIGDWATFKQYVGTDVSKFEQVIDLKVIYSQ
jgi:predicted negative regulator of RcsB-dependent stress response